MSLTRCHFYCNVQDLLELQHNWGLSVGKGAFLRWVVNPFLRPWLLRPKVWYCQVPYRFLLSRTCILSLPSVFSEKEKFSVTWAGVFGFLPNTICRSLSFQVILERDLHFLSIAHKIMISFNSDKCFTQLCCLAGLFENHPMHRKSWERPRKVRQVDSWSKTWQSWAPERRVSLSKSWEHFGKLDQPLGNF